MFKKIHICIVFFLFHKPLLQIRSAILDEIIKVKKKFVFERISYFWKIGYEKMNCTCDEWRRGKNNRNHHNQISRKRTGVDFINVLRSALTLKDPKITKITKRQSSQQFLFALLGSLCMNTARKMLMKSTFALHTKWFFIFLWKLTSENVAGGEGGRILHFESTLTCHKFLLLIVILIDRLHYETDERGKKYKKFVPFVFIFSQIFFSLLSFRCALHQSDFDESSWINKNAKPTFYFQLKVTLSIHLSNERCCGIEFRGITVYAENQQQQQQQQPK